MILFSIISIIFHFTWLHVVLSAPCVFMCGKELGLHPQPNRNREERREGRGYQHRPWVCCFYTFCILCHLIQNNEKYKQLTGRPLSFRKSCTECHFSTFKALFVVLKLSLECLLSFYHPITLFSSSKKDEYSACVTCRSLTTESFEG